MKIVICDEHHVFADALEALLMTAGHDVAGSARELSYAAEIARSAGADACITDLQAPRAAGMASGR